jgi:iron complex transport system ATP-binding protein
MTSSLLSARGLTIGYHSGKSRYVVSEGLDLGLLEGELVCLIGPNGAGKSTLIRTLMGMQPPLQGDVILQNKKLGEFSALEKATKLSVVLTTPVNVSHFTAFNVAALGRYPYTGWRGILSEEDRRIVSFSLDSVGATELSPRFMGELSDGEKQKVMIARGLAQDPAVLILDEPTAYLDLPHKIEILRILKQLSRHPGRAVLLSIHDLDLAMRTADRIWLINMDGEFFSGAPEDLVLRGVFSSTFRMGGVHFDTERGIFVIPPEQKGVATVTGGSDIERIWTVRALERAGYTTGECEGSLVIEIGRHSEGACWNCRGSNTDGEFSSLGELVHYLKHLPSAKGDADHPEITVLDQEFDDNVLIGTPLL